MLALPGHTSEQRTGFSGESGANQHPTEIGAGVVDLSLQDPGTGDIDAMMRALELFGKKILPRIREI
jgi:hypothetical protein